MAGGSDPHRRSWPIVGMCVGLLAGAATSTRAQVAAPPIPATTSAPQTPPAEHERVDVIDVIRHWRGKPLEAETDPATRHTRVVFAPVFGSKPTTGFVFGVGASLEIPLGDETTRLSSVNTSLTYSTKQQLAVGLQPTLYGRGDRWLLEGQNLVTPYGVSDVVPASLATPDANEVSSQSIRVLDTYAHRIHSHVYAGAGFFYSRQSSLQVPAGSEATSPFIAYSIAHGFKLDTQVSAGPGASVIVDTRDYPNDPGRGYLADVSYRAYVKGFLGGDSTWERLIVDLRAYRWLAGSDRQRLALWSFTDLVTSGTAPYLDLPTVGGDLFGRTGRGYAEGQIRGDHLMYVEAEYRASLMANGLIGLAIFANAATAADPTTSVRLFDQIQPGGGAGLRLQLHKRSRTNLCLDFGVGRRGSHGVYMSLGDAF